MGLGGCEAPGNKPVCDTVQEYSVTPYPRCKNGGRKVDHAFHRLDDVEEQKGSLEVHADPEERREEGVFPWGEEVLEDVRDKVGKGGCGI